MVPTVRRAAERYLAQLDRVLPGAVSGFYVVGSTALGTYVEGRSDIDFVAVLDGDIGEREVRRLRAQHLRSGLHTGVRALAHRQSPLAGTCNGVFIRAADLATPVTEIVPVASHAGPQFKVAHRGSDVSPVGWKVFAERGIPLRGPDPSCLPLDPQPALLREWNLANLDEYWRPWAAAVERAPARFRFRPRYRTAWGALGPTRLHHTIATGEVISKEAAGEHALDVFDAEWHPLLVDALAYRRGERSRLVLSPEERGRRTAAFVIEVADAAARA